MKAKKWIAVALASITAVGLFAMPQSGIKAQAFDNWNMTRVYTYNAVKDMAKISICTPQITTKAYAGLTWEQMEMEVGVRLNVTESACGADAMNMFHQKAASVGGAVIKVLDMDFEKYMNKGGWTQDTVRVNSPIRIAMTLPAGADMTKDYAFISIKQDGNLEVLGDLDGFDNGTITVDSAHFDTWALITGPKGAFNAYRTFSPKAVDQVAISNYVKYVGTTVSAGAACHDVYSIGMVTDAGTVQAVVGGKTKIEIRDVVPGPSAQAILQNAAVLAGCRGWSFHDLILTNGKNERVYQTNQKLRVTVTVPFDFPAYADYGVAILDGNGAVTIMKDIDINGSTVSFDTDQFRNFAIVWAPDGTL